MKHVAGISLALLVFACNFAACSADGNVPMETAEYEITRWSTGRIDTVTLTIPQGMSMASTVKGYRAPAARCWNLRGMYADDRRFYLRGRRVRSMDDVSEIRKLRTIARYPDVPEDSLRRCAEIADAQ